MYYLHESWCIFSIGVKISNSNLMSNIEYSHVFNTHLLCVDRVCRELYLSKNQLTSLPSDSFQDMPNLFQVSANPTTCFFVGWLYVSLRASMLPGIDCSWTVSAGNLNWNLTSWQLTVFQQLLRTMQCSRKLLEYVSARRCPVQVVHFKPASTLVSWLLSAGCCPVQLTPICRFCPRPS